VGNKRHSKHKDEIKKMREINIEGIVESGPSERVFYTRETWRLTHRLKIKARLKPIKLL
jgi:hypothetical protein